MREQIISILAQKNIPFTLHEHPAVFTADEAKIYCSHIPGTACKNLFLTYDGHFYLYILPDEKKADIQALAQSLGVPKKKLRFASAPDLMEYLGVEPGSVSPLCLLVTRSNIPVIIDKDLNGLVTCHPGINTATVSLQLSDVIALLDSVGIVCSRF